MMARIVRVYKSNIPAINSLCPSFPLRTPSADAPLKTKPVPKFYTAETPLVFGMSCVSDEV